METIGDYYMYDKEGNLHKKQRGIRWNTKQDIIIQKRN